MPFLSDQGVCLFRESILLDFETIASGKDGEKIQVQGTIPKDLECFQDHFPEFPILPGVLSVGLMKQVATRFLVEEKGWNQNQIRLKKIRQAKFTSFLQPGTKWNAELGFSETGERETLWNAKIFRDGKKVLISKFELIH